MSPLFDWHPVTGILGITAVIFAVLLFSLAFDLLQALKERTKNIPVVGGLFGVLFEVIKGISQAAVPVLVLAGLAITGFQGVEGLRQCLSDIRRMAPSSCLELPDVTDEVAAPNEYTRSFVGVSYDEGGRFVKFEFFILTRGFYWDQGKFDQIVDGTITLDREGFQNRVLTPNVRRRISTSQALISMGLSSREGDLKEETDRAGRRAETIARWTMEATQFRDAVWILNMGKFVGVDARSKTDSFRQRPVILVAVRASKTDANFQEALRNGLAARRDLPYPTHYSSFNFYRFRVP